MNTSSSFQSINQSKIKIISFNTEGIEGNYLNFLRIPQYTFIFIPIGKYFLKVPTYILKSETWPVPLSEMIFKMFLINLNHIDTDLILCIF